MRKIIHAPGRRVGITEAAVDLQALVTPALGWIESTAVSQAMRGGRWLYPAIEALHIAGFVLLVGGALLFDLRVLGFSRSLPPRALSRLLLRGARVGFAIAAPAGLLLFSADPVGLSTNPALQIKLGLIALAGVNIAFFHYRAWPSLRSGDPASGAAPLGARASALLSIVVWLAVIGCGRLIAYV